MNVYRVKTGSILPLGKQGENLARKIQFDISRWIGTLGPGTVQLLHQRRGDEAPYPVAVEREGNFAVWTVTNADTAAPGTGHAELQYYVGDALAKSETWMTKVLPALGDASETPPEAQQGWVDQVLAQVARITGMTAQAVELPAGSAPTADYADGVLTIGIPQGGDVSEAQIAQAVAEYLSKNPIAETDPTVPDWAKEEKKPSYTAAEVGADPSGTAASQVEAHSTETTAHSDIRLLIQGLAERLNTLADSDDTTLDQLSEIVAYIKSNRDLIAAVTTDKVGVTDIVNDLVTNVANKPLSAAQGVALKALIDALDAAAVGAIPAPVTAAIGQTIRVSAVDDAGKPTEWEAVDMADKLPNPNALTFTGAVSGSYDGSAPLEVAIPSGGSAGSEKAKTQILIDQEITELTASLSVTLDHDFHNLTAIINCGSAGPALTADSDGTAVASKIGLLINTTSFGHNSRKPAYIGTSKETWKTAMFGAEWSDDLSVFKRGFAVEIATGKNQQYYFPFGGTVAMYGTLGTDDNAPRTGKTANIVVNGAYLNVGTRVVLWGEYYE